ncbi:50S ribosomal protein L21 [Coxiella endosymbiont of Dermacentor marginatus]|uniref:50S ribosomal protein L21 n=1 Tax=Coxiella endosymbiont of Dermacentor marginatus TaxID=1656159 RepID=UPI0022214FEA|nr:50S ribosomal protein L21 [Coxiella endosymbiont of Dermacentor marginatus]
MYAIVKTGGKQYRVTKGKILKIEKLAQKIGASVEFNDILLIGEDNDLYIGSPQVTGAKVIAEIVDHGRAAKIDIIKFKRRKHYMKRMGHRQDFTTVKIIDINLDNKERRYK